MYGWTLIFGLSSSLDNILVSVFVYYLFRTVSLYNIFETACGERERSYSYIIGLVLYCIVLFWISI